MLRWSSSSATLWLWQPLSAVFARHTLVVFQSFDTLHNHEAITTLSPGRAALRGENGRSPRKAPPRAAAPATRSAGSAIIVAAGPGSANALSRHTHHLSSFFLSVSSDTHRLFEGACCARAGLRSRRAACTSLLQVTCWGVRKTHTPSTRFTLDAEL